MITRFLAIFKCKEDEHMQGFIELLDEIKEKEIKIKILNEALVHVCGELYKYTGNSENCNPEYYMEPSIQRKNRLHAEDMITRPEKHCLTKDEYTHKEIMDLCHICVKDHIKNYKYFANYDIFKRIK